MPSTTWKNLTLQKAINLVSQIDPSYVPEEWKTKLDNAKQESTPQNEKLITSQDTHLGKLTITYYMSTGTLHLQGAELIIQLTPKIIQDRYNIILQKEGPSDKGWKGVTKDHDSESMPNLAGRNSYLSSLHRPKRHIKSGSQLCKARINAHVNLLEGISEFAKSWKLGMVDHSEPYLHRKQLIEDIGKYIDAWNQEDPDEHIHIYISSKLRLHL